MLGKLSWGALGLFMLALGALAPTPAKADLINFDFSGSDGAGTLTATGTLDVVGGQAISGSGIITTTDLPGVTSDSIQLVTLGTPGVHDLGGGNLSYRFGGGTDLTGDTVIPVDGLGLVFSDGTSLDDVGLNLWFNGGDSYTGFVAGNSEYDGYNGTLSVSAVPEPASLALLGTGLIALYFITRRRQRNGLLFSAQSA